MDSKVSIVVPIYNVERYLNRCLDSIRRQTYKNIQVIMVNDGSKDSSRKIAATFESIDDRFLLVDKENGGLSSARNYGMKYVLGDFVSFIDSDDFLALDYVETLVSSFDKMTDIVIADYVIFDQNANKAYRHSNPLDNERFSDYDGKMRLLEYLLYGIKPVMPVWKNMYRSTFYLDNNLSFDSEREIYAEDFLFHTKAYSLAREIKTISKNIYYHLIVNSSLSQGYRKNYFEMNKELYYRVQRVLDNLCDNEFANRYKRFKPSIIGSSLLHSCKCNVREAVNNVNNILSDQFVREAYQSDYESVGPKRYWILYRVGKVQMPLLSVFVAKMMLLSNPLYRRLQKKQEYKIDG